MCVCGGEVEGGWIWYVSTMCDMNDQFAILEVLAYHWLVKECKQPRVNNIKCRTSWGQDVLTTLLSQGVDIRPALAHAQSIIARQCFRDNSSS